MKQVTKNEKVGKPIWYCTHHNEMIGMFNMLLMTATANKNKEKVILVEQITLKCWKKISILHISQFFLIYNKVNTLNRYAADYY